MSAKKRTFRDGLETGDIIFWVILKDHIDDTEAGTSNADQEKLETYKDLLTHKFKLYDDDGELYYTGVATNQSWESAFEPLDWGMANAGCTDIKYQNHETKAWESL